MDDKLALFARYIKQLKKEFGYIQDMYPEEVQTAHEIMFQVGDIFADPANASQSIREAIYAKVPREKIKWALQVVEAWKTADQRKADSRAKERQRRHEGTQMEDRSLTKEQFEKLYDSFDTSRILAAIDALDEARAVISDQFNADGFPRPPQIRDKLLKLHEKANELINGEFSHDTDMGLFDLAWEIEDELFDVMENLEKIKKVIDDLTDLTPSQED